MNVTPRITVLLADDHLIVREGLMSLLESEHDIEVIGEAADGRQTVELFHKLHPDVISMDISMPVMSGFEATRQILLANPATKVIMLSTFSADAYIEQATALGAKGYLVKQNSAHCLAKAIREVYQGKTFFPTSMNDC